MLRAAWNLFRLGLTAGFNTKNAYWTWRNETAFGKDPAKMPDARERRKAALEYGEWVGQMRKLKQQR